MKARAVATKSSSVKKQTYVFQKEELPRKEILKKKKKTFIFI